MKLVTRTDEETGQKLLWCGDKDFDIIKAQLAVYETYGMQIMNIRDDKWALLLCMRPAGE